MKTQNKDLICSLSIWPLPTRGLVHVEPLLRAGFCIAGSFILAKLTLKIC